MDSVNVGEGASYELPECDFTPPSGKTFSHWLVGGVSKNPHESITVTQDTEVIAQWKNLYVITYSAGEGNGESFTIDVPEGDSFTLKTLVESGFTAPSGKAFTNWRIGNTDYDPGDTISNVTSNMTVTAIWGTLYSVSFNFGLHGSGSMDPMSGLPGTIIQLPQCGFTAATGYRFDHWLIGEDTYDPGDDYEITNANVVAYAIWEESSGPQTYTVTQTAALSTTATAVENDSNVTIKVSSANGYTDPIRVYANSTITIYANNGATLVSVTYCASSTGNYVTYAQNATVTPEITPTVNGKNVTWTFGSNVTEFTFKPSAQTRCTSIIIVYSI